MKLVSVVGARPNFVKLAALHGRLLNRGFDHVIVHTGQHYDYEMSRVFFEQLDIPQPDHYLGVGSGSQGYQVGEIVRRLEAVLNEVGPDAVIVYGDTNSTMAAAVSAVKAGYHVAHVEAGLRSFEPFMQEEVNRKVTDHVSSLLFAPTPTAVKNLENENVYGKVFLTGDVHVDLLSRNKDKIIKRSSEVLEKLGLERESFVVVTIHRAENTDDSTRLAEIVKTLEELAAETTVVFPLHPRTRRRLKENGLLRNCLSSREAPCPDRPNLFLLKPLGYLDFLSLVSASRLVLTDSGGVQREAYLLKRPTIVLRERTEWAELVDSGWVITVGVARERVISTFRELMEATLEWRPGLLGDGRASERISFLMESALGEGN